MKTPTIVSNNSGTSPSVGTQHDVTGCRVAEFFEMRALRTECICVIGKKATADHLPLLAELCSDMSVAELAPLVSKLRVAARL